MFLCPNWNPHIVVCCVLHVMCLLCLLNPLTTWFCLNPLTIYLLLKTFIICFKPNPLTTWCCLNPLTTYFCLNHVWCDIMLDVVLSNVKVATLCHMMIKYDWWIWLLNPLSTWLLNTLTICLNPNLLKIYFKLNSHNLHKSKHTHNMIAKHNW